MNERYMSTVAWAKVMDEEDHPSELVETIGDLVAIIESLAAPPFDPAPCRALAEDYLTKIRMGWLEDTPEGTMERILEEIRSELR